MNQHEILHIMFNVNENIEKKIERKKKFNTPYLFTVDVLGR